MNWQEICDNPTLKDLPFKIESNQQGQILMTPVKVYHSLFQGKIAGLLYANLNNGEALVECAISTRKGTKVADVAWASDEKLKKIKNETECSIAPDICVEVMSLNNTQEEMAEKKKLYFENGALEVWICDKTGHCRFFAHTNELEHSLLAPHFPNVLYKS